MPPPPSNLPTPRLLPEPHEKHSSQPVGPIVGTIIILILLALGALYFWGAHLNQQQQDLPLIQGNTSTQ